MSATSTGIALRLDQVFNSEIAQARRLGYRVATRLTPGAAVVRLVPATQRTQQIARDAGASAIESTVPYQDPRDLLAAVRAGLDATLLHARDAAA